MILIRQQLIVSHNSQSSKNRFYRIIENIFQFQIIMLLSNYNFKFHDFRNKNESKKLSDVLHYWHKEIFSKNILKTSQYRARNNWKIISELKFLQPLFYVKHIYLHPKVSRLSIWKESKIISESKVFRCKEKIS